MDVLTPTQRSENMRRIRGKHTKPELLVRKILRRLGFSYRLHSRELPGSPDIVIASAKRVIFVHGCFWHHHQKCRDGAMPKTNVTFWRKKFENNLARDRENQAKLRAIGWKILVIWECEIRNSGNSPQGKIEKFLS